MADGGHPTARATQPHIRPARLSDASDVQAIYAPFVADTATSFELEVPDVAEIERRMALVTERLPWLVAEAGTEVVGYAYADAHRDRPAYQWSLDSSVYVRNEHHARGVGTALYRQLISTVTGLGYASMFAGIALPNEASVRLHKQMGFRHIGTFRSVGYKLGRWHDVGWWGLRLRPPSERPDPPKAWRPE